MPGVTRPKDPGRYLGGTQARVERVERKTVPPGTRVAPLPFVFSYPGTLAANVESPPWYPQQNIFVVSVRVSLLANATTDHVVELRVDGAAIAQFTLTAPSKTVLTATALKVGPGSYVTIKTITVADADMSVELGVQ